MTSTTWTIALFAAMTTGMNVMADRCRANEPAKPIRIVWTGASFVPGEIIDLTTKMINQDNDDLKVESKKLSRGWTSLGSAIQRLNLLDVIAKGKYDYVVVNEIVLAVRTRNERECHRARQQIAKVVATAQKSGATPIFFCTWLDRRTMEDDFDLFVSHYEELTKQHNGVFAPIGPAWKKAWEQEEEKTLRLYSGDRNHASARGAYLAACVMYSALTGKSPVGNLARVTPSKRRGVALVDEVTAKQLQTAAWESFQEFRKRKDIRTCVLDATIEQNDTKTMFL